jgi:hypothetical protein
MALILAIAARAGKTRPTCRSSYFQGTLRAPSCTYRPKLAATGPAAPAIPPPAGFIAS